MKHILLTRFAMKFATDNPRTRYEKEGWIDYRMELFKKYCLPSVQGQSFKNFDWYFLVHPGFIGFSEKHEKFLQDYGTILYTTEPWSETTLSVGKLLEGKYSDWVCSTRLDSDDCLHRDFFKILRSEVKKRPSWHTFKYGYITDVQQIALREYVVNPFVSRVEKAPIKTVLEISHVDVDKHCDAEGIEFNIIPMIGWAQIDHGSNIKNLIQNKIKDKQKLMPLKEVKGFPWLTKS